MEQILAEGKADVVYMARALLADPFLPRKVEAGKDEDIVKCLRCFTCMAERAATATRRCTVNPFIGREMEGSEITPAPKSRKVVVVGAGPGGLKAAHTAALRGHKVILMEKEDELGGILKSEQALPFKREMYELSLTFAKQCKDAGVEICLQTNGDKAAVEKECPDAVIVAAGSEPFVPPIPGICEIAIHLAQEGKKVTVVEMRDMLAPDANVRHRPLLLKEMEKLVEVRTGLKGIEITEEGVLCEDKEQKQHLIKGSSVICALGQRARSHVADDLRDTAPYVAVIGDCGKAATITNAVYQGYHAALDII